MYGVEHMRLLAIDDATMPREYSGLTIWNWLVVFGLVLVILLVLGIVFQGQ